MSFGNFVIIVIVVLVVAWIIDNIFGGGNGSKSGSTDWRDHITAPRGI